MPDEQPPTFGPNAWLVDDMYDQYRQDPNSVSESWREFFADYRLDAPSTGNGSPASVAEPPPAPSTPAAPKADGRPTGADPLRGAAAR
ncbi:MAG TPA: hypothetical protein VFV35_05300, partial [Acidimicrobiales bacterium]|nr:hypothetical protein [Acidimicrobiales bacterium]